MRGSFRKGFLVALFLLSNNCVQLAYCQNPPPGKNNVGDYLNISGSKIYYEECGSGPTVVLLHDGLLHSITWDRVWPRLCKKYHVVRYDRRGYGRSDPPKSRFSSTEDLYALLTHLSVQRAIVVGNSSGGALAIDIALAHPEMIEGLFLLGPIVQGMDTTSHFDERNSKNNAPLEKGDVKATAENWSKDPYVVAPGHHAAREKIYQSLVQNPQDLTHSSGFEIPNPMPSLYRLSEIHVPTSILVGEFDIPDVHAQGGAMETGIPGAQRDIVKNAGHLIQLELPAVVAERLSQFIDLQERKGENISPDILKSYVGKYDAAQTSASIITIDLRDGQLVLQTPGAQPFPLFAKSESKFFLKVWDLEIEFIRDSNGKVVEALIYLDGSVVKAPRL